MQLNNIYCVVIHVLRIILLFLLIYLSLIYLRPRWVVPVLPKGELEVLLEAAIDLSKKGRKVQHVLFSQCFVGLTSR